MGDLEKKTAESLVIANVSEVHLAHMVDAYCGAIVVMPCRRDSGILVPKQSIQGIDSPYKLRWERKVLEGELVEFMPKRNLQEGRLQVGRNVYEVTSQSGRRIVSTTLRVEYDGNLEQLENYVQNRAKSWIKKNAVPTQHPRSRMPGRAFLSGKE